MVLERSRRVKVVPARFGWLDLGSLGAFGALAEEGPAATERWASG